MLGAIAGDIIGSIYEAAPIKTKNFRLFGPGVTFTDGVLTVAIADALLSGGDFAAYLRDHVRRYPNRGYGGMFLRTGLAMWLARRGVAPDVLRAEIENRFGYDLGRSVDQIRTGYARRRRPILRQDRRFYRLK